mgnify:CR=1 FL=1
MTCVPFPSSMNNIHQQKTHERLVEFDVHKLNEGIPDKSGLETFAISISSQIVLVISTLNNLNLMAVCWEI